MLLLDNYQILELIFAFVLFIPFFYLYYKIQGINPHVYNILLTAIFVTLIILIKDIIMNYNKLISTLE